MTRIVNPISPSGQFLRNPISPFTGSVVGALPPLPTGGLLGHYDASDPDNTDAVNDGDPLGLLIDDLSPFSSDMSQTTGARKPTYKTGIKNGLNVARCDGGDVMTRGDDSNFEVNNFSLYVVVGRDTAGNETWVQGQGNASVGAARGFGFGVDTGRLRCFMFSDPNTVHETFSVATVPGVWGIFTAIKFGTTITIYWNGIQQAQRNDAPASIYYTGAPKNTSIFGYMNGATPITLMDGDGAQTAIYGIAHSDSIRDIVHNILSLKWDIALTL